jgi:hypothetical protein
VEARNMKERLEDILSDADTLLRQQDATEHERKFDVAEGNEVDHDTAARFNHAPSEMKSAFSRRYPRTGALLALVLLAVLAWGTYMDFTMPNPQGDYHLETATVQSSGIYSSRPGIAISGATARLLLQNGNVVVVRVDRNAIPPAGMRVLVRLYDTGAVRLEPQH